MQYLEFQIVDEQQKYRLSLGRNADGSLDVARQTAEMTAYMNQLAEEQAERDRKGLASPLEWNPFPKWVKALIKTLGEEHKSKVRFDNENRVYRMRIKGERQEFEDFYEDWHTRLQAAKPTEGGGADWLAKNDIRVTATDEDENAALYELDSHHSGYPSVQTRGGGAPKTVDKKEETARAIAAQG